MVRHPTASLRSITITDADDRHLGNDPTIHEIAGSSIASTYSTVSLGAMCLAA